MSDINDNNSCDYDILLVNTREDLYMIKRNYCHHCVDSKLTPIIIKKWTATNDDFYTLRKNGVKIIKVRCKCGGITFNKPND